MNAMFTSKGELLVSFEEDRALEEIRAEKFAMELLMPAKTVREEHAKMVIPISRSLAEKFQVPVAVMKRRLDRLELMYID